MSIAMCVFGDFERRTRAIGRVRMTSPMRSVRTMRIRRYCSSNRCVTPVLSTQYTRNGSDLQRVRAGKSPRDLRRNGRAGSFYVPHDRDNPPPALIFHELNAVDTALDRRGICRAMAGLIDAEKVDDMSERMSDSGNFDFRK